MFKPTKGKVFVNGLNLENDLDLIRNTVGICH